jgi:hypothetical protein
MGTHRSVRAGDRPTGSRDFNQRVSARNVKLLPEMHSVG